MMAVGGGGVGECGQAVRHVLCCAAFPDPQLARHREHPGWEERCCGDQHTVGMLDHFNFKHQVLGHGAHRTAMYNVLGTSFAFAEFPSITGGMADTPLRDQFVVQFVVQYVPHSPSCLGGGGDVGVGGGGIWACTQAAVQHRSSSRTRTHVCAIVTFTIKV